MHSKAFLENESTEHDIEELSPPASVNEDTHDSIHDSIQDDHELKRNGEDAVSDTETNSKDSDDNIDAEPEPRTGCQTLFKIYRDYDFLFWLLLSVPMAKAWPELGAVYLQPAITASWIAVMYIFLISGLSLKTSELTSSFQRIRFHLYVQSFNFIVMSSIIFGFTRILIISNILIESLADGMAICGCLPMAINMVIIMAKTSHGDDGTAVLNSAIGNLLGVFISPLLIMGYLGVSGDVNMPDIFYKLAIRVVVPLVVGQAFQLLSPSVSAFCETHMHFLSKSQMFALLYVVYTVFCASFMVPSKVGIGSFMLVLFLQFLLLCFFTVIAWYSLRIFYRDEPTLRVTGLFACTHKTISLGVPVINAMYQGSPDLALYILPALMWYPLQLVIGSFLAPRLRAFVEREQTRLAAAGVVMKEENIVQREANGGDDSGCNSVSNSEIPTDEENP